MGNKKDDKRNYGLVRVELAHVDVGTARKLKSTINYFRDVHAYIVHVVVEHADDILPLSEKDALTAVERLIHHTEANPNPQYPEYDVIFNRYPSCFRRAAINSAVGHVSSHDTRYDQYHERRDEIVSRGHHFTQMEPRFCFTPNACPSLFKGAITEKGNNTIAIKVIDKNRKLGWGWATVYIPERDMKCLRRAMQHGELHRPKLVYEYHKFYLEYPVEYKSIPCPDIPLSDQTVLSVDRGFNHGAVCSVVTASGSVLARYFDPYKADMARIDHVINLIRKAGRESGTGQSLASLYTKLEGLKDNYYKQISRWIVNIATSNNVYGIVLEHLESTKRKGRKRGRLRARVQHWLTAKMRDLIKGMAYREGIRTFIINPWGTSQYAYDGSGKVGRDEKDYSQCVFSNGKHYNCDLSASYNIAARYFLRELKKSMSAKAWSELKAKVPELSRRTAWTLNTLRLTQREMSTI